MKWIHGLTRAKYWAIPKLNVQLIITAIVVNVKRFENVCGQWELSKSVLKVRKLRGIEGDFLDTHTGVTGPVTLTKEWKKYTIDLSGTDLSYISGGFCLTMTQINNPNGAVIYLDDIRYVK